MPHSHLRVELSLWRAWEQNTDRSGCTKSPNGLVRIGYE